MKSFSHLLFTIDEKICRDTQVSAKSLSRLTTDKEMLRRLIIYRMNDFMSSLLNIIGTAVTTYLFSFSGEKILFAGISILATVLLGISRWHFKNKSGNMLKVFFRGLLKETRDYHPLIKSQLRDKGFTSIESDRLQESVTQVYVMELSSVALTRFENLFQPIAIAVAMVLYGEYIIALITVMLGILSFPLGQYIYKVVDIVNSAKHRIAHDSESLPLVTRLGNEHVSITDKLNLLSSIDKVIFAGILLLNPTNGNLLANINGLGYGFSGLKQALTQQRTRSAQARNVEVVTGMIETLTSDKFIFTQSRWAEHSGSSNSLKSDGKSIANDNVLMIKDFQTMLPSGEQSRLPKFDLSLSAGKVVVFKAASGVGKTTLLSALMHKYHHTGELFIKVGDDLKNVHSFDNPTEIGKYILYESKDTILNTARIVDVFRGIFMKEYDFHKIENLSESASLLLDAGYLVSDNILENELEKRVKNEASAFPKELYNHLKSYQEDRYEFVNNILSEASGNLSQITSDRKFGTLSEGEKQRLTVLYAREMVCRNPEISTVILDEPLGQIDKEVNLQLQLDAIETILNIENPPGVIVISHQYIDVLEERFGAEVVRFEK